MKVEITKAQIIAIENVLETAEGMVGAMDEDFNDEITKGLRMWDRFLNKNNLPKRKYGQSK